MTTRRPEQPRPSSPTGRGVQLDAPTQHPRLRVEAEAELHLAQLSDTLTGWNVLLWNDDHNSMDHVVRALVATIGLSLERAVAVMYDAHEHGKTVAWSGAKEPAELYRDGLEAFGLTATISR